ncbi:alpha/beta fold hydrolase [Gracilibacillus alcaliphilus]|uniref:alpha/beta fold hydrolase n=1 Tax=Gracilibacillus alcaliphilus TaxID=1401441 RepID=UPI00195C7607|nr:alpha/beta hydrolase [Gracilibacillus alcaliphilus]MBM7678840.1 pimeloyl-ACP methyl ester carboxylesterase [Gracilibacillus alcaliphilus]
MDLYYEIKGNGQPVVLIHGGGTDLREWNLLAPILAKHYQVISVDGRGVGQSPTPKGQVNYVEDIRFLIDELGLGKPAIIGHSIGGQIATEFALAYPEKVTNLVLIAPALSGFQGYTEYEQIMQKVMGAAPDVEKMVDLMLHSPMYQVVIHSPQRNLATQMLQDQFQRVLDGPAFEMIWPNPPAIDRLEELTAKTLFIIGEKDLAENFLVLEHFRRIPNVHFIEIPGADHMLPLTHYEALNQEITAFMEE